MTTMLFDGLARLVDERLIQAKAVYAFWPAHGEGDDLVIDTGAGQPWRVPMLRGQGTAPDKPNPCLADLLAPADGPPDHVGAFAVTAGLGVAELTEAFQRDHDDYNAILVQALADRLAEAAAEWLHRRARQEWGQADEDLAVKDLHRERFAGIRPAFGYPACPDHEPKQRLFELLDAPAIGLSVTEHGAILPTASVSGLFLGHPDARYFNVGRVDRDQLEDYARRWGQEPAAVERRLGPTLGYDPDAPR